MVGLLDSSVAASLVGNYTVNGLPWHATIHGTEPYVEATVEETFKIRLFARALQPSPLDLHRLH